MNLTDGSLVRRPALIPGLAVLAMFCVVNAGALPKDTTFRADGPDYIAEATGKGESESSRSDERRVGKECRSRTPPYHYQKRPRLFLASTLQPVHSVTRT